MSLSILIIIISILFIHWFADFVCQTEEMALGKSKSWGPLLRHTFIYSLIWFIVLWTYALSYGFITGNGIQFKLLWLAPITFIFHTITDYFTSRINAKLWEKKKTHQFFVSIGFDQLLHYIQLFITYYLLTK